MTTEERIAALEDELRVLRATRTTEAAQVAPVSIKLPSFWLQDPVL